MAAIAYAEWHGLKEALGFLDRLGANAEHTVARGMGRAAIRVQDAIRSHLQNMIYSQPSQAGGYERTYTLMRSLHAARPSANHGGDEMRAQSGQDLAATSPDGLVEASGNVLATEVGSWISYAGYVHDGVNQPQPRPFIAVTVPFAEAALEVNVMEAILQEFATAPRG